MPEREYDLVIFGATGFTGRLVAEQLAERAPEGTRIALAGRSLARLGAIRDELPERAAQWPLLLADSADRASLNQMARSATAIVTTVGPYLRFGLPLVGACAKAGTHYVDLTGEVPFMRASIDAHHDQAAASGARIVHACGFDSIPSDLGVLVLHQALGALGETTLVVESMKGGVSGGTLASMRAIMEAASSDQAVRAMLVDPYSLTPDREAEPDRVASQGWPDERDLSGALYDPDLGWLGPFVMAQANTRVVRRSNAVAGYPYSRAFRYQEAIGFGQGLTARAKATGTGAGLGALTAAMGFGPTRAGAEKVLAKPGEGPGAEARASGHFRMAIHGRDADDERWVARVAAKGDPGYAATAVMLAESALLVGLGDAALPDRAGVLTPATGLGMPLVERLRAAAFTFDVQRWEPPASRDAPAQDAAPEAHPSDGGDAAEG